MLFVSHNVNNKTTKLFYNKLRLQEECTFNDGILHIKKIDISTDKIIFNINCVITLLTILKRSE